MVFVESSAIYVGALVMSVVSFLSSCMLFETYHEKDISVLKNLVISFFFMEFPSFFLELD